MSDNLMDTIKGAIPQQVMQQIGGMLGTDEGQTSSAVQGIAGSILGGMMKRAQTDQGANEVFDMVNKQDDGILDKLGDLLGGGDDSEVMKQGGGILEGVLGGSSEQSSMVGMIAKALGLDEGMIGKLMMMIAPMVMGAIGRYVKGKGMDAGGFKNLLGQQGANIAGALPGGMADQLGLGNMVSSVSSAASSIPEKVNVGGDGAGAMKFVLPLLLVVGLILAGIFIIPQILNGGGGGNVVTKDNIETMEEDVVGKLETLAESIKEIKDTDQAEKVRVQIDELRDFIGGMKFRGVSSEDMQGIKGRMDMRLLKSPLADHAYNVEGVQDILDKSVKALAQEIEKVRAMEK